MKRYLIANFRNIGRSHIPNTWACRGATLMVYAPSRSDIPRVLRAHRVPVTYPALAASLARCIGEHDGASELVFLFAGEDTYFVAGGRGSRVR